MSYSYPASFFIDLARGLLPGQKLVERSGHHLNLTSTLKDVWADDLAFNWQTSAQSLEFLSSSANDDDLTGSGGRTLKISGLDTSWAEINETKSLDGTAVVACTNTYRFVDSVEVIGVGSSGVNEGNIDVRVASAGAVLARVGLGDGIAGLSQYVVPANKTAYLLGWSIAGLGSTLGTVEALLRVAEDAASWKTVRRLHLTAGAQQARLGAAEGYLLKLPAKARLGVQAASDVSGAGISTAVSLVVVG